MSATYTRSQLQSDVNAGIKGKIGVLIDAQSTLNQGVREVLNEVDLRSNRRRSILTPNLFSGIFEYAAPSDLKGYSIITIQNQKWTRTPSWELVPYEQFMRRQDQSTVAISDYDMFRKVFINSDTKDTRTVISNLDSLTSGGGTWGAFGDATNVLVSDDNFVEGNGSIKFDINASGGTTAGIVNSTLSQVDTSQFFRGDANGIAWAYIVSTTGLTSYSVQYGSDSSNYYSKTVTSQSDGTAFVSGWNILNFNLATFTTTGTPVITAMDYCAIYMNKLNTKINEVGYRFDYLALRRGEINNLYYYSNFGWQSSTGVYKENSTTSSDFLNADGQEYELIKAKCIQLASFEVDEDKATRYTPGVTVTLYNNLLKIYKMRNPSEALHMISTVADFVKI